MRVAVTVSMALNTTRRALVSATWLGGCLLALLAVAAPTLQLQAPGAVGAAISAAQAGPEGEPGKRAWSDLSSGWGKRGWQDLQVSSLCFLGSERVR